ncbi:MAG TPA: hypothetical protein VF543_05765 [Pyrinomonadaceae bacterium]|jgi:hypothetical protein
MGRAIAVVLLLLLFSTLSLAQNQALLVDGSASMRPYYAKGLILDLSQSLNDVLTKEAPTQLFIFSENVSPISSIDQLTNPALGNWTYIDRTIDSAIQKKYRIAWIITDNMESRPSDPEAANTEVFYQRLRSPQVKKVVIFPLVQAPGDAGLVIYAIQFAADADEIFEKELTQFSSVVKGVYRTEPLRMKPLDQNTIDISFVRGNLQPKGKSLITYQEGQNISEKVELRFKSRFEHLKIVDARINVPSAEPRFSLGSLLQPEKREINIDPQKVSTLDPQGETEQSYEATVNLGKVTLKRTLSSLWKAAWSNPSYEDIELPVSFVINVPQENFRFKDSVLRTYGASTPQAAKDTGKIYGLEKLPQLMGEPETPIQTEIPLAFRVQYPWWPAAIFVLLFILGLIIAGVVLIAAKKGASGAFARRADWAVTAQTVHGSPLKCELEQKRILVQGEEVGQIKGNSFIPASGVKVEGGLDKVNLEDKLSVKIERKGKQSVLSFNKSAEEEKSKAGASAYTPRKR